MGVTTILAGWSASRAKSWASLASAASSCRFSTTSTPMSVFGRPSSAAMALVVVPGPNGVLVVVVGDKELNVGLARLEMLRVAEAVL